MPATLAARPEPNMYVLVPANPMLIGGAQPYEGPMMAVDAESYGRQQAQAGRELTPESDDVIRAIARHQQDMDHQALVCEMTAAAHGFHATQAELEELALVSAALTELNEGILPAGDAKNIDVASPRGGKDTITPLGALHDWSRRALRLVALQRPVQLQQKAKLTSLVREICLAVVVILLLVGLEIGLVSQLSTVLALGADPTGERTLLDRLMQVAAAMMMVTSLSAVMVLANAAVFAALPKWVRAASGSMAVVLGAGTGVLAAAVCWPAFGPMVQSLISGESGASGMALDIAPSVMALPLRLLMATPLVASGLLAGVLEQWALRTAAEAQTVRTCLKETSNVVDLYDKAESHRLSHDKCLERMLDDAQAQRKVEATIIRSRMAYQAELLRLQPARVMPHRQTLAEQLQNLAEYKRQQQLVASAWARGSGQALAATPGSEGTVTGSTADVSVDASQAASVAPTIPALPINGHPVFKPGVMPTA